MRYYVALSHLLARLYHCFSSSPPTAVVASIPVKGTVDSSFSVKMGPHKVSDFETRKDQISAGNGVSQDFGTAKPRPYFGFGYFFGLQ